MDWISVKERLPERENPKEMRTFCAVALDDGTVTECAFEFDNEFKPGWIGIFNSGWHPHDGVITHWIPWKMEMKDNLPDPPQK